MDEATACSAFRALMRKAENARMNIVIDAMKNKLELAMNLRRMRFWEVGVIKWFDL